MIMKRLFDLICSTVGIIVLLPLFLAIAAAIKLESRGPVFFRQERVGLGGRIFRVHKFRTMVMDAERHGLQLTAGGDSRVTAVGAILRKHKLDELAQLIDVIRGDMSLVGPRPEVPHYLMGVPPELRDLILSVKPGITDRASIEFRDENRILGQSSNPERAYIEQVLPIKQRYYAEYVRTRTFWGDISIIIATLIAVMRREPMR